MLAQSYDWLIFLNDIGLSEFIETLILNPSKKYLPVKDAFISSYTANKKRNRFTKVQMDKKADEVLQNFFIENTEKIKKWFNIISPAGKTIAELKNELEELKNKNWKKILKCQQDEQ